MVEETLFLELVRDLQQADQAAEPVRSYFVQGEGMQVSLVAFDADVDAPEKSHPAQWVAVPAGGRVDDGRSDAVYRRGDAYSVPAGVPHAAHIRSGSHLLDVFGQADRFRRRSGRPANRVAAGA